MCKRSTSSLSPSSDSVISRYIHPAEPVYQVHPPRPVCGDKAYTSAATTYGSTLYVAIAVADLP